MSPRRASRVVSGLTYAAPCLRPSFIPTQRYAKGAKGAGLRYEKLVAKALPRASHGQWFHFIDENGPGWCQPDVLLIGQKNILVLECKLTYVPEAEAQLAKLYIPVVEMAFRRHTVGAIIAKNLSPEVPINLIRETLAEAICDASPMAFPIVHWLGRGSLR